jgi:spermidine synthase
MEAGEPDPPRGEHGPIELMRDLDRPHAWLLVVGGTPQSYVDLDDPQYLEFEYIRRLGHVLDVAAPAAEPMRVLHLGGGALSLARYVAATRPGSSQLAIDTDAELVAMVQRQLPIAQPARKAAAGSAGRVRVRVGDARDALERARAGSFDAVVVDAFIGARTPGHLTSKEFAAAAARALDSAGVYAANIADGPPLAHARARVAAVRAVFEHVYLIADAAVLHRRRFGNLVVAGAARELPVANLTRRLAGDPFPARLVDGDELDKFIAGTAPITDDAPQPSPAPPPSIFGATQKRRRRQ